MLTTLTNRMAGIIDRVCYLENALLAFRFEIRIGTASLRFGAGIPKP